MKKFSLLVSGLATVTMITGAILMSTTTSADSRVDEISVTIETACTMTGTGMNSHNATINPGTYQADIGITTLKAFCNDANGFAIYAAGYTGDEIGGTNSTKLVNSAASTNNTINTGTDTTGTISNWAMKLNTNSSDTYPITLDNSFGSYHVVPASYTKVAHRDSATDVGNNATGSTLTTTYAAAVASTQAPGTYAGKVIYTLVHPSTSDPGQQEVACEAGKICYNANSVTVVGQMGKQTATNNTVTTLWASNFKRDGYGFAGWNDKYDYTGNFYGPNQDITAPSDVETNGLSLYAVWIPSAEILQNWNGCSSMNTGDVTALTDNRDNDTYAVAKLADGKCWMIENLRLDNIPELSSSNTNNPSLPIINIYDDTNPTTSNHLSSPIDPTQTAWGGTSGKQSMLATNNTVLFINNNSSNFDTSGDVYSYGNNYNWYSAVAGYKFYYNGSNNHNSPATGDICPAGWHLIERADFYGLNNAINSGATGSEAGNRLRSYPVNIIYPGYVTGSSYYNRGSIVFYWYHSFDGNGLADGFWLNSSGVHIEGYLHRVYGVSVRCVAGE